MPGYKVGPELNYMDGVKDGRAESAIEVERLRAWIRRIDSLNDNPAVYNSEINAACHNAMIGAVL